MLDDYVTELKKRLQERRDVADKQAIYSGGDVPRGMVQAYEAAILDADEILEQFREPEEVPSHLKTITVRPFGGGGGSGGGGTGSTSSLRRRA